ncbi:MAG: non-ribosomal peptide synthetase, partial [Actinobacteria bacterium]|nr:non-ribosomal peptide synthetase [Actinomycetota bacterium]
PLPACGPARAGDPARPAAGPVPGSGQLVGDVIAGQAAATPQATAVVSVGPGGEQLTYRELSARAARLARQLTASGVGPDVVAGVYLDAGTDFIVAVLAVLKAGGGYLPLDPGHPAERIEFMLRDAAVPVVVTTAARRGGLPAQAGVTVVTMDEPADGPASPDGPGTPAARPHPDSTAYVIYTSGSTGAPKAVVVGHGALASSTAARRDYYAEPVGTFLLLSPVTVDSSVAGIFWTLCSGGTLVLPGAGRRLVDEISRDIAAHRVSHILAVPSVLSQLADWHQRGSHQPLDSLRVVISAGEPCPADLAARLLPAAPNASLCNEYGPTEAAVWSAADRVEPGRGDTPAIGTPVAGATCQVLDARLRPVPPGVPGELCVGGAGLARGYLAQPSLTAERFVASPLAAPGSRLYRTGDLARWRPDGRLEFLGRIDSQIKIAGYRVEPGEVEATLTRHPDVATAAVTGWADQSGDLRLVAYLVPAEAGSLATSDELRDFCEARLPEYMIPAFFVPLAALPVAASGKVDRDALPAPRPGHRDVPRPGGDAGGTPVERQIAEVWQEVLGVAEVGQHDDFFELGGHSLQVVRVSARLQEIYDVELPLRRLFEATTVAGLAALLTETIAAEVSALSEHEVEAMLAEQDERAGPEPGGQGQ